jgi:hypothetical protein
MASKTHKDRVQEFNSKLEMLSEHHDIPKVGLLSSAAEFVDHRLTSFQGWAWITTL